MEDFENYPKWSVDTTVKLIKNMVPNIILHFCFINHLTKISNMEKRFPIWKYSVFGYVCLF